MIPPMSISSNGYACRVPAGAAPASSYSSVSICFVSWRQMERGNSCEPRGLISPKTVGCLGGMTQYSTITAGIQSGHSFSARICSRWRAGHVPFSESILGAMNRFVELDIAILAMVLLVFGVEFYLFQRRFWETRSQDFSHWSANTQKSRGEQEQ